MKSILIGGAVALAMTSNPIFSAPIHAPAFAPSSAVEPEQLWLAKNHHGSGKGKQAKKKDDKSANGNARNGRAKAAHGGERPKKKSHNEPAHAGGAKPKNHGERDGKVANGSEKADPGRRIFSPSERRTEFDRQVVVRAPDGRDMVSILAASGLAFLTPQLALKDIPNDDLIRYQNCPPGLAKKDPPCVPPGLAKKGVTYDAWVSYDPDDYSNVWIERRDEWLRSRTDADPDPDLLLLQSDQIATLYDLDPAPEGWRYALIDGQPVLLDEEDYRSLLMVNQMAQVPDLTPGIPIAPTAALTQSELVKLYRLSQPGADENYSVVNGQLVRLSDTQYELLQMIRIARAIQ